MEDRYKLEIRDRDPKTITDLSLDNCKSESVKGLGDDLTSLVNLSMINIGLTSLEGLPSLPELLVLDISDNKLDGGLEVVVRSFWTLRHLFDCCIQVKNCPKLERLIISRNNFSKVEQLEPLKDSKLGMLDTFHNEIENLDEFRFVISYPWYH